MDVTTLAKLRRPPIVEAVVDFDCDMPLGFDLGKQREVFTEAVKEAYPTREVLYRADVTIEGSPEGASSNVERGIGVLRFRSADRAQLVQYRDSGFTFNRLAPYTSFDDYSDEITRCWVQFVEVAKPVVLRRLRLRYINELSIPLHEGMADYARYINCAAALADKSLKSGEFLTRINVADAATSLTGVVVSASRQHTATHAPVIVDIAVQTDMTCELSDLTTIRWSLDLLRRFKNRIFASVITQDYVAIHGVAS